MQKIKLSEKEVQDLVIEYCKLHHAPIFRCNAGDNIRTYKGKSYRIKGMPAGFSDLIMLRHGVTHYCEIKSSIGVQSEDQKNFQSVVENAGCPYHLIRSLDQFMEIFKDS